MKKYAFTMAEILISLTIIGIIAAITLPALQGNINEKTWNTQRKALHSRLSQAIALMPALNGFGTTGTTAQIQAKAAETFITEGLSKVFKINNICDKDHLADCGIPDKITILDGSSTINTPTRLTGLHSNIMYAADNPDVLKYITNTYAAAFETINGESILTFYNPYCTMADVKVPGEWSGHKGYYKKLHVCANFVYDLNGSKGPNTVGKDIGYISALYAVDPSVVMVLPTKNFDTTYTQEEAIEVCRNTDSEYRLPNAEEAISIYYNSSLLGTLRSHWTSTNVDAQKANWVGSDYGILYTDPKTNKYKVTCVKR